MNLLSGYDWLMRIILLSLLTQVLVVGDKELKVTIWLWRGKGVGGLSKRRWKPKKNRALRTFSGVDEYKEEAVGLQHGVATEVAFVLCGS